MQEEARLVKTCFIEGNPGDVIYRLNDKNYSIKFLKISITFEPSNFDYISRITKEIENFEESGRSSMYFPLYAGWESFRIEEKGISAIFLMPGLVNQSIRIPFDPVEQKKYDEEFGESGKTGLKIECRIEHA